MRRKAYISAMRVTHIVQAGLLFCKINGSIYCTICKNIAGICRMAEGDDLVRAAEQYLVVAHDAAAAHGADADLLGVALLADSGTVINIVVCAVVLFVDGVSQHQTVPLGASSLL